MMKMLMLMVMVIVMLVLMTMIMMMMMMMMMMTSSCWDFLTSSATSSSALAARTLGNHNVLTTIMGTYKESS